MTNKPPNHLPPTIENHAALSNMAEVAKKWGNLFDQATDLTFTNKRTNTGHDQMVITLKVEWIAAPVCHELIEAMGKEKFILKTGE